MFFRIHFYPKTGILAIEPFPEEYFYSRRYRLECRNGNKNVIFQSDQERSFESSIRRAKNALNKFFADHDDYVVQKIRVDMKYEDPLPPRYQLAFHNLLQETIFKEPRGRPKDTGFYINREEFVEAAQRHIGNKLYIEQQDLALFMNIQPKTFQRYQQKFGFASYREFLEACRNN